MAAQRRKRGWLYGGVEWIEDHFREWSVKNPPAKRGAYVHSLGVVDYDRWTAENVRAA